MEEEKKTIDDFTIEIPENDISGDKEREENSVHDGTDALGPSCCKDESNDVIEELQESKVSESEDVSVQENTISRIEEQLQMLNDCFEQKIKTDAHKAELFDKMYDELQSYKTDLYAKILKPFILSTIALIDDTNSFLAKLDENDSRKAEKYGSSDISSDTTIV
jgi:copper chaperone CopZ